MKKLPLISGLAIAAILLAAPPFLKNYGIYLFSYWMVFVIATMGLNLTVGYKSTINDSAPSDLRMDGIMVTLVYGWHPLIEGSKRLKSGEK